MLAKRKKIVILIDSLGSGGAQRRAINIAILLKEKGYDVSIMFYVNDIFYEDILKEKCVNLCWVRSNSYFSRIKNILKQLKKMHPDAMISFMETPNFIACLSKLLRVNWIVITTESSAKFSTFKSFKNRIFNVFHFLSTYKVCNSYNSYRMWVSRYPSWAEKCKVIYNPVIIPQNKNEQNFTFFEDGKVNVLVAASYQELKNPLRVIRAVSLLNNEERQRLHISWYGRIEITTGCRDVYDEAQKLINNLKLGKYIKLNGETKSIYEQMACCDAVGLFSTVEGLPNAICEAITLGKIIIMSKVSDYEKLVDGNGFLCDPNSVESIAEAFKKLLKTTRVEANLMSENSRRIARLFEPKKVCAKWEEIIDNG